jgi:hypothetical protein
MPSVSKPQQRLMALAYFHPSKVNKKNRGVVKMGKAKLHEFMSLKKNAK